MFTVKPNDAILGATIDNFDASQPMNDEVFGRLLNTLGRYGVLRFPNQALDAHTLKAFSERFGDIQSGIGEKRNSGVPEVGILSNVRENGEYIGLPDAGQDWHTDMSYRDVMGFVNVLYGVKVPVRDGKILALDERGQLLLIKASPEKFELLDTKEISNSPTWAHIAVAGNELFIRELNAVTAYRW